MKKKKSKEQRKSRSRDTIQTACSMSDSQRKDRIKKSSMFLGDQEQAGEKLQDNMYYQLALPFCQSMC